MKRNSNRIFRLIFIPLLLSVVIILNGCEDDPSSPPPDENPQELITTITLLLVNQSDTTDIVTAEWKDIDGAGGNLPSIDTLVLSNGVTYNGSIELLDESKNPPEDITEEVKEEANTHQFFYTTEEGVAGRITITKNDFDTNNPPLPVGLDYIVEVSPGGVAEGILNVILSHYDEGPKTSEPGIESDIDIDFPVRIN